MGFFDKVFSRENVAAREAALREAAEEQARKEREQAENADPALQYFLELISEQMAETFAKGANHYWLSYADRDRIPTKVKDRYGMGYFGIKHEVVARILDQEGFTCERRPLPHGGYWIRLKSQQ